MGGESHAFIGRGTQPHITSLSTFFFPQSHSTPARLFYRQIVDIDCWFLVAIHRLSTVKDRRRQRAAGGKGGGVESNKKGPKAVPAPDANAELHTSIQGSQMLKNTCGYSLMLRDTTKSLISIMEVAPSDL
ncbi:probable serine threonine- kinase At1g09600 [Olea europaea subsp. europaea]|uniref:Probable serine threonine- kinase At1g09600 n=1 Tax=Olea europaea subsp. europaea TaxID=158383 RepID=A0A8S0RS74_OLEEU|nr:probable serine threonine- kinase At1g09600 [Olea europaea subsp. europaea]